jgi:hypothetical protein
MPWKIIIAFGFKSGKLLALRFIFNQTRNSTYDWTATVIISLPELNPFNDPCHWFNSLVEILCVDRLNSCRVRLYLVIWKFKLSMPDYEKYKDPYNSPF